MYTEKGYVNYVEKKQTKNGKTYTTFLFSVPDGKDSEGKPRYKRTHWKSWQPCAVENGDYIVLTGDIYEDKDQEGKSRDNHIVVSISILSREQKKAEQTYGNNDQFDNIPF